MESDVFTSVAPCAFLPLSFEGDQHEKNAIVTRVPQGSTLDDNREERLAGFEWKPFKTITSQLEQVCFEQVFIRKWQLRRSGDDVSCTLLRCFSLDTVGGFDKRYDEDERSVGSWIT